MTVACSLNSTLKYNKWNVSVGKAEQGRQDAVYLYSHVNIPQKFALGVDMSLILLSQTKHKGRGWWRFMSHHLSVPASQELTRERACKTLNKLAYSYGLYYVKVIKVTANGFSGLQTIEVDLIWVFQLKIWDFLQKGSNIKYSIN